MRGATAPVSTNLDSFLQTEYQYGMRNEAAAPRARPVLDTFRLDGRVAVVTGGSSTLGRAIGRALAEAGASVVLASRDVERCTAAAAGIERAEGAALDLADPDSIDRLVDGVKERHGRVDVLVNNAVSWFTGHVARYGVDDWEASLRVDGTGFFRITQRVVGELVAAGGGSVVNIASVLGTVSADPALYPAGVDGFRPPYFFVKAGMINYTRFLAVVHAEDGVRVNCVSPGGIQIEPPRPTTFAQRVPMKRTAAPHEIAAAVVFLASDAASYVTGHNLVVDGGYTSL
jgi:NAD(P)-dependent dehydrogenase (short-subunit alcohol dehydrogenase family)